VKCGKTTPAGTKVKLVEGPMKDKFPDRAWTTKSDPFIHEKEWWAWVSRNTFTFCTPVKYLEAVDEL
jgi:hypothetical protein